MTLTVHIDLRTKINVNKVLDLKIYVKNLPNIQAIVQGKLLDYQLNELLQQLVHD